MRTTQSCKFVNKYNSKSKLRQVKSERPELSLARFAASQRSTWWNGFVWPEPC